MIPKNGKQTENKINNQRITIRQLTALINCKKNERFTKALREKFRKKYDNIKRKKPRFLLKQDLKPTCRN